MDLPLQHHCPVEGASAQPRLGDANSFTNQSMAQIELSKPADYKNEVLFMPGHLDEEVARLNLATLGVRHTEPTKTQAKYRGVAGPHKADRYRY